MEKITITVGSNTEILKAPRQGLDVTDSWSATVVLLSPLCWYTVGRVMCFLSKLHTSTWKWQEKHKPRSEKDKKNMGKYLETHFSTLFFFFTQIIKIWLATFGTKFFSNFTGLQYSWATFYSPKTWNMLTYVNKTSLNT